MAEEFKLIPQSAALVAGRARFLNQRHDLLTQNLAHIETPNYKAKDLKFEEFVSKEQGVRDHTQIIPRFDLIEKEGDFKANNNNVYLEDQMAKMTNNSVEYMASLEVLKRHLSFMKFAAQGA